MIKRIINLIKSLFKSKISIINFIKIKLNKNESGKIIIDNEIFNYTNGNVFINLYNHIFLEQIYYFSKNYNENYVILDCGANIGMASMYFRKKYPNARIIAFEPDIKNFEVLKANIIDNKIEDIALFDSAIWIHNDGVVFEDTNNMASKIVETTDVTYKLKSKRLLDILNQESRIDFLKLDIEGAEAIVIEDCKEKLHIIDKMFIEYHSNPKEPQQLQNILQTLTSNGFRYYIKEDCSLTKNPFSKIDPLWGYDLQLQIFAYK